MSNMFEYMRRNRREDVAELAKRHSNLLEEELVLRVKKQDLFDSHVLLPHAEVNEIIYNSVDTFVEKYAGENLKLSIFTDPVSESVQHTFQESYRAHYAEEYQKITRYLRRRYIRVVILLAVSIGLFFLWDYLLRNTTATNVFLTIMTNMGAFCLWEVGYTYFARAEAVEERKQVARALNAKISFIS